MERLLVLKQRKGLCIPGDNLGSHHIGGLAILSTLATVKSHKLSLRNDDSNVCGLQRTPERYDSAVQADGQDSKGITVKCSTYQLHVSVFNTLKHFHFCQPAFPPC